MGDRSRIEWTDATWNPVVGCSIVSPGCTHCYAMATAHGLERRFGSAKYAGLTKVVNGHPVWTGTVRLDEAALAQPLRWRRPRRIFVNSMSDLFHEGLDMWQVARVFAVMAAATQHEFQVLTKRSDRMRALLRSEVFWQAVDDSTHYGTAATGAPDKPLPNVWLGVSVEDQARADERTPLPPEPSGGGQPDEAVVARARRIVDAYENTAPPHWPADRNMVDFARALLAALARAEALQRHYDAACTIVSRSPFSSRPLSCYIEDLRARAEAAVAREIEEASR